jgi:acetyltransferase-like isoleucine patch superfamily enzyme
MPTPIAIFTYNRPSHTRQLFESLLHCCRLDECDVVVFCDGPKKPAQAPQIMASRAVVDEFASRLGAQVLKRQQNMGLARSIVSGVTELCAKYGRVIVLEDDLILHPFFLDFILQSLDLYEDDERVAQVAGFTFPIHVPAKPDAFFLPATSSWGWATWQRAWNLFSWETESALKVLEADRQLRARFDLDGAFPLFDMLRNATAGKVDSWVIRWYWQVFQSGKLVLYPRSSLVWQNGFDNTATHTMAVLPGLPTSIDDFLREQWQNPISFPDTVQANEIALDKVKKFLRSEPSRPRAPLKGISKRVWLRLIAHMKKLIDQLILKLFSRYEFIKERQRWEHFHRIATIASTTTIAPEGAIENILGDPRAVVVGENSYLRGRLLTYGHGGRIEIGNWCYLGERSEIWSMDSIMIGDHVLIGHDVNIHDGTGHPLDAMQRRQHYKAILTTGHPRTWDEMPGVVSAPVVIEDDVSIGFGTTILQGVHIGARSIIAPGSMITKDVPPDVMYISTAKPILMPLDLLAIMRTRQKDA